MTSSYFNVAEKLWVVYVDTTGLECKHSWWWWLMDEEDSEVLMMRRHLILDLRAGSDETGGDVEEGGDDLHRNDINSEWRTDLKLDSKDIIG